MKNSFIEKIEKGFHYGEQIHPVRDWLFLLTLAGFALAGILVWNAWLFDQVALGASLGGAATSTPALFSKSSLQNVEQLFGERALLEQKYSANDSVFTDPSR